MSNFNANRDIDIQGYYPAVLAELKEFKAIAAAEQSGVEAVWQAVEDCLDDQFIGTATQHGIARRETLLSIVPYASDTLEDRRFALLSRYNESVPYTRRSLEQILVTLCGTGGYTLAFLTGIFTVHVKVALTAKKQVGTVTDLMERVLPYNMVFTVELLYNCHETLSHFNHAQLSAYTHEQLRSEVLPNA